MTREDCGYEMKWVYSRSGKVAGGAGPLGMGARPWSLYSIWGISRWLLGRYGGSKGKRKSSITHSPLLSFWTKQCPILRNEIMYNAKRKNLTEPLPP